MVLLGMAPPREATAGEETEREQNLGWIQIGREAEREEEGEVASEGVSAQRLPERGFFVGRA